MQSISRVSKLQVGVVYPPHQPLASANYKNQKEKKGEKRDTEATSVLTRGYFCLLCFH